MYAQQPFEDELDTDDGDEADEADEQDSSAAPRAIEPSPEARSAAKRSALAQLVVVVVAFFAVRVLVERAGLFDLISARYSSWEIPAHVFIPGASAIAIVAVVLAVSRERWASIGAAKPSKWWLDLVRGLSTVGLTYVVMVPLTLAVALLIRGPAQAHMTRQKLEVLREFVKIPLVALVPTAMMAGFYEELLVRGFVQSRVSRALSGSDDPSTLVRYGAVCIGAVLFGLGHVYQGPMGVFQTTVVGVILGVVAARFRSIWPAVVAHVVIDTVGLVVSRVLVPAAQSIIQRN